MVVLGALVFVLPGEGAPPAKPGSGKDLDASELGPGTFAGKLVSVPDSDRMFTVAVAYQQVEPNPNFRGNPNLARSYQNILRIQAQMGHSRNPAQQMAQLQRAVQQFQMQVAQTQMKSIKVVNATQNVDFQAEEKVVVRTKQTPAAFDEKGNIKKYTPAEMRELKGKDPSLPGYESSVENLKPGQLIQVTLKRHQAAKTASAETSKKDSDKGKDKDKDKDLAPEKAVEKKMQVRMIMIVDETGDNSQAKNKKGKN
jgi:hypothetical protein